MGTSQFDNSNNNNPNPYVYAHAQDPTAPPPPTAPPQQYVNVAQQPQPYVSVDVGLQPGAQAHQAGSIHPLSSAGTLPTSATANPTQNTTQIIDSESEEGALTVVTYFLFGLIMGFILGPFAYCFFCCDCAGLKEGKKRKIFYIIGSLIGIVVSFVLTWYLYTQTDIWTSNNTI